MSKSLCIALASCLLCLSLPALADGPGPRASILDREPSLALPAEDGGGGGSVSRDLPYRRRSPVLAGALSLVLPGAGQLYNEEYVVGGLWMAGELALYLGAFAYAGAFDSSEQFSLRWRFEGVLLLAIAGGFHLFSIYDAVTEASRVNENLDKFALMVDPDDGGVTVGYRFAW